MSWRNIYFPKDTNENLNIDIILSGEAEVKNSADDFNKRIYLSSTSLCFHFLLVTTSPSCIIDFKKSMSHCH